MKLRTEQIVKRYRKRTVVNEVSLFVEQGEIVGLLGPNGAGKTTSFYIMVGLIKPLGGEVFLDDLNITRMPMYKRAQQGISYLPQEASIFRQLTVEDNIKAILEFTKLNREQQKQRLEQLLDEFGLQHVRKGLGITFREANAAGRRSPAAWPPIPNSSCSTNPLRALTPSRWRISRRSSQG